MTIEEKAKAYDEVIERAKEKYAMFEGMKQGDVLEDIFPELKESEDEKIKEAIIVHFADSHSSMYPYKGFTKEQILAWLEKQGEQKSVDVRTTGYWHVEDTEQKPIDKAEPFDVFEGLTDFERTLADICIGWIGEELGWKEYIKDNADVLLSLAKKELMDKVEPKFKVGDWISGYYTNYKVLSVNNDGYVVEDVDGNKINILFENEKFHHLWTIQDAKDGDVLVASDGSIFIFKGAIDCACKHYIALTTDGVIKFNEGLEHYWETSTAVHPAIKEQRDILKKAMADAGYNFDFDKKELKKIKQKPAENKEMNLKEEEMTPFQKEVFNIIDTNIEAEVGLKQECDILLTLASNEIKQQQTEWSEEDDGLLEDTLHFIQEYQHSNRCKDESDMQNSVSCENWLKSLRPQKHWKPSEEQMEALKKASKNEYLKAEQYDILVSLYNDLKAL